VGSSSSTSFGWVASARAISSRRWSPYGRFPAASLARLQMPTDHGQHWSAWEVGDNASRQRSRPRIRNQERIKRLTKKPAKAAIPIEVSGPGSRRIIAWFDEVPKATTRTSHFAALAA
jgi:hypothetical protein